LHQNSRVHAPAGAVVVGKLIAMLERQSRQREPDRPPRPAAFRRHP